MLEPAPPVVPLLIMIRLTEDVMAELQKRNCGPLENFVFSIRLQMWPVFQKAMGEHIDSVKRLAEGSSTSLFRRGTATTDLTVANVGYRCGPHYLNAHIGHTDLQAIHRIVQLLYSTDGPSRRNHDFLEVCRPCSTCEYGTHHHLVCCAYARSCRSS